LCGLLMFTACGCEQIQQLWGTDEGPATPPRTAEEIWAERVAGIEPGMTRAQVEAGLPPLPATPVQRSVKAESQTISYWLDKSWKVSVEYDFTGAAPDKGGKTDYDSPQNKVLSKPTLEREFL